jgi:hypothetical protein
MAGIEGLGVGVERYGAAAGFELTETQHQDHEETLRRIARREPVSTAALRRLTQMRLDAMDDWLHRYADQT